MKDSDLVKSMTSHNSFSAADVGSTYIFAGEPYKDSNDIWQFPMYHLELEMHLVVSQWKLNNTLAKGSAKMNWFQDSMKSGTVKVIKLIDFKETVVKPSGNFVLPKFTYLLEPIAEHSKKSVDEVNEILWDDWDELSTIQQRKRNELMRWVRKQPYKDVVSPEFLTGSGTLAADTKAMRSGKLVYEVLERITA